MDTQYCVKKTQYQILCEVHLTHTDMSCYKQFLHQDYLKICQNITCTFLISLPTSRQNMYLGWPGNPVPHVYQNKDSQELQILRNKCWSETQWQVCKDFTV